MKNMCYTWLFTLYNALGYVPNCDDYIVEYIFEFVKLPGDPMNMIVRQESLRWYEPSIPRFLMRRGDEDIEKFTGRIQKGETLNFYNDISYFLPSKYLFSAIHDPYAQIDYMGCYYVNMFGFTSPKSINYFSTYGKNKLRFCRISRKQ